MIRRAFLRVWGQLRSLGRVVAVVLSIAASVAACNDGNAGNEPAIDAGPGDVGATANNDANNETRADGHNVDDVSGDARSDGSVSAESSRPRVVVETSGAPGELLALGRLLFYADEIDIRGIILTDATVSLRANFESLLDAYEQTRPALQRFAGYPDAARLRAVTIPTTAKTRATDATAVAAVLSAAVADGGVLTWLGFAPGAPELRRALDHLFATASPTSARTQTARLRLHGVELNDGLGAHAGELAQLLDFGTQAAADARATTVWSPISDDELETAGPLGAKLAELTRLPVIATVDARMSGGAAWLTVLPVLPGSPTTPSQPTWGSWGGRFVSSPLGLANLFVPALDDVWQDIAGEAASVARFAPAALADFRGRLSRARAGVINRPPVADVRISDATGRVLVPITGAPNTTSASSFYEVAAGAVLMLDASPSSDLDGQPLNVSWSLYREASRFPGDVTLRPEPGGNRALLEVPLRLAEQQNVHVLCEVADTGTPPLIRHRRLVLQRSR